jgi:hypothetical protein
MRERPSHAADPEIPSTLTTSPRNVFFASCSFSLPIMMSSGLMARCFAEDETAASSSRIISPITAFFPSKAEENTFFMPTNSATRGEAGRRKISAVIPICSIRPELIMAARSARKRASLKSWVTIRKVMDVSHPVTSACKTQDRNTYNGMRNHDGKIYHALDKLLAIKLLTSQEIGKGGANNQRDERRQAGSINTEPNRTNYIFVLYGVLEALKRGLKNHLDERQKDKQQNNEGAGNRQQRRGIEFVSHLSERPYSALLQY